ncbi:hypothetical protein N7492_008985 [Penicillium capsulatum]|uniref:Uncharacterized protein n=1 Tax=Penicillium capsulatum TaxID=69766 RepID=A0A9W9HS95_9EURO|nr:hypothetical protein N7492_008985 [Penicillium capsulatum]KAJ6106386.1 hypothetical protein N7512_009903 [Penicillium capsulatum]
MALRQHVRKPQAWHEVDRVTSVYFTQSNITFINLEGLLDNSLLLTFRYHSTKRPSVQDEPQIWQSRIRTCKTRIRRRAHGFLPSALNEGRLVQDIEDGSADEMIMQLRIPDDRAMAWKTVALALLTLRQIDRKTWHLLASIEDSVDIAGFSWEELMLNDQSITGEGCDSPVVNMLDETRESTGSEDRALSYWVESHTSPAQVCLQGTW